MLYTVGVVPCLNNVAVDEYEYEYEYEYDDITNTNVFAVPR